MQSGDWQDRESGILLLFSISQYVSLLFDFDSINRLLITGLQDSSAEVVYMTIKATASILTNSILNRTSASYCLSIECCIQLIPILSQQRNEEYVSILLSVFSELATAKSVSKEIILSFMKLAIPVGIASAFKCSLLSHLPFRLN